MAIARIWSHRISLTMRTSGGATATRVGSARIVLVSGSTTIRSERPLLYLVLEMTRPGRRPACSCPIVGSKFTNQISPLWADLGDGGDWLIAPLLRLVSYLR